MEDENRASGLLCIGIATIIIVVLRLAGGH